MLKGLAIAAGAWVLLVALVYVFQRKLIYLPMTRYVAPAAETLEGAEDVAFETEDGVRLGGWFVPGGGGGDRPTVLFFNGNAGDRSMRAPFAEALAGAGYSVLLFDYRGYGGNPGSPSEAGLLADARAARSYLAGREDVDPDRIVYFGESLGSGVAVALALEQEPAGLVLRSPFTSLPDVGQAHYFFLPVRLLLKDRFPSIDRIGRIGCPLLVIAGDRDSIIPVENSIRVYDAARGSKRLVLITGADHNDDVMLDGQQLVDEVRTFLATASAS